MRKIIDHPTKLLGWVVIWCPRDSDVPRMVSNLADQQTAQSYAQTLFVRGDHIVLVIKAEKLWGA